MKVLYQFAQRDPTGWQQIDASQWATLPKRPVPQTGQLGGLNDQLGWLRNVSVQGITNEGIDHVAIEDVVIGNDTGVKMTSWNDDPVDFPIGERQAIVWTILPLAPDPNLGMAINTRQSCVRYCEGARYDRLLASPPQNTTIRPWSEFVVPPEAVTRHGILLDNVKFQEHLVIAPQAEWGWRHWVDHLPDSEVDIDSKGRRKLKVQRDLGRWKKAAGTITYYQRDTARAQEISAFTNENALETSTAVAASQSVTTDASAVDCWSFCTPADEPNSANWPSGQWRAQWDCTAASGGLLYGARSFGAQADACCRVNSALNSLISLIVVSNGNGDSNDFSGTGLKLSTSDTTDPAAGNANERFTVCLKANGDSKNDAITLELNTTDSYADGPWAGAAETPEAVYTNPNLKALTMLGVGT